MHDNFNQLLNIQRIELSWDLLTDEHRIIEKNGKKLFYDSIKMDDSLLEDKSSSSDISTSVLLNVLIIHG